jgi:hypothetical protein
MKTYEQEEIIFYQDNNVTVTQSRFIASGKIYSMRNISSVSILKIEKSKIGAIVLIVVGIISFTSEMELIGLILTLIGGVWIYNIKDEYAVRISTNAGEANSLIHNNQAYIQKIVTALNDAIIYRG